MIVEKILDATRSIEQLRQSARDAFSRADYQNAANLFQQLIQHDPADSSAWFMLGACLDRCNLVQQAEHAFAQCEALNPNHPEIANARGSVLIKMNRIAAALAAFDRARRLNPRDPQILTNIGIVLEALKRHGEAMQSYDQALDINPDHLGALNNRGALLLLKGKKKEALADHQRFARLAPNSINGHYFSAETLATLHRDTEALAANDAALAIDPQHAKSLFSRAVSLSSLKRWDEAEQAFLDGLRIVPAEFSALLKNIGMDSSIWQHNMPDPRNVYCLRKLEQLRQCDWQNYDEFLSTFKELLHHWKTASTTSYLDKILAHPCLALPLTLQEHANLASSAAAGVQSQAPHAPVTSKSVTTHQKLRIGYLSPDFREHATIHLTRHMYGLHDRTKFSIYCYSISNDASSPSIQKEIAAACDAFRDVSTLSTAAIDALIRKDEIDILIDLAGYTAHAREALFSSRPAPLCAAYLGYAGSVGLDGVDYYISDSVACNTEQIPFFSEKIVTLPRSSFCYNDKQEIAAPLTRTEYGLPTTGFIFCCLNNTWKLEPTVFDSWMRILARTPDSVLWLFKPNPDVEENLREEAHQRGIDPSRLVFADPLPVKQHLARYLVADLFLDTFYYGGHTTTLDALWAGCPVVTKLGAHYASRVSSSHLTTLKMPELITGSVECYENLAVELATSPDRLEEIRKKIAVKRVSTSLFDPRDLVRNLERAYQAIWARHQAGLSPAAIHLS
ncbi:O-linked N-acetylglucosamine transferase, SPINDLY family protein [Oxalicibacterium faecigallinarum]|nr:tetratricopeptide repeat protein [Oxalicibacterium faecigallinarum]